MKYIRNLKDILFLTFSLFSKKEKVVIRILDEITNISSLNDEVTSDQLVEKVNQKVDEIYKDWNWKKKDVLAFFLMVIKLKRFNIKNQAFKEFMIILVIFPIAATLIYSKYFTNEFSIVVKMISILIYTFFMISISWVSIYVIEPYFLRKKQNRVNLIKDWLSIESNKIELVENLTVYYKIKCTSITDLINSFFLFFNHKENQFDKIKIECILRDLFTDNDNKDMIKINVSTKHVFGCIINGNEFGYWIKSLKLKLIITINNNEKKFIAKHFEYFFNGLIGFTVDSIRKLI